MQENLFENCFIHKETTKEVKFVMIENFVGTTESEILEWKSSLSTE